jgi:AcrR family transcriptional regulator
MMLQLPDDIEEKQARILNAALGVFAAYGLKRSSMEDIAKAADMSRAALYQHFRNKEDILSTGVRIFFARAAEDLETALSSGASLEDAIRLGCFSTAGDMARFLLDSPHGEEMLQIKTGEVAAHVAKGEARMHGIWTEWLEHEAAAGRVHLPKGGAASVATAIIAGQYGQKASAAGYDDYIARLEVYAEMMGRALRA